MVAINSNHKTRKLIIFFCFVFSIFILDRCTKFLSSFVEGCFFFCIQQSTNFGAAFALFSQFAWIRILLIIIALIVLALTAVFYFKIPEFNYIHIGFALLFTGTFCNLFDRLFFGYVIDFITFSFMRFPAFNIADAANIAGVILLIIYLIRK